MMEVILNKYTLCKPCVVEDEPDAHTVWLKVGVQSFCITPQTCETKEDAELMRCMLAHALSNMIREYKSIDLESRVKIAVGKIRHAEYCKGGKCQNSPEELESIIMSALRGELK